ncbi:hypothetical protein ACMYR3_16925 (plasmid) [Ampullimonas aquatilis]|uniref:hypothetical protein n=1 Tax=Ampullimonas aquatilis TaxID=1341549 RepID=UPI003C70E62E
MKTVIKLFLIIFTISLSGCENHSAQDELAKKQLEIIKKDEEHRQRMIESFNAPKKLSDGYVYHPSNTKPDATKNPPKE